MNIRIGEEAFEVLAAAAFMEDVSVQDLLRPLVEARIAELEADSGVMATLEPKRRKRRRNAERQVSSLEEKRLRTDGR